MLEAARGVNRILPAKVDFGTASAKIQLANVQI